MKIVNIVPSTMRVGYAHQDQIIVYIDLEGQPAQECAVECRRRLEAAPELYRALDELLHAHDRGAVPLRSDVLEAMDRAEAALRKARGE